MRPYYHTWALLASLILMINLPLGYQKVRSNEALQKDEFKNLVSFDTAFKTIHVFVALCDNKYQGIVPVPAAIGNGQDKENNLYWGCSMGIRSYFKKSSHWSLVKKYAINGTILERIVFKHKTAPYYLIADAYNGKNIKECTMDFLKSCAGSMKDTIHANGKVLGIYGQSKLLSYIGHDGLMDFSLPNNFQNIDHVKRDAIVLACISKKYFNPYLAATKANPLIWTTGLMCPEAYTLHDAIEGYVLKETPEQIRTRAAKAYTKYQKCGERAARNLLVTGY